MIRSKCPKCGKTHLIISRPSIKDTDFPFTTCPHCGTRYVPEVLKKRTAKPYRKPRKPEILLCGLPAGIIGLAVIIISIIISKPLLTALGGIIFSFWILLIAMSISLWNQIIINSEKEYEIIKRNRNAVITP